MLEQKLNFITKGLKAHVKASYNSGVTLKKLRKTSYPHYETIVNEDGTVNLRKVGAVSYTHLDVYKRQALGCVFRTIDRDKNSNLFLILFFRRCIILSVVGIFYI